MYSPIYMSNIGFLQVTLDWSHLFWILFGYLSWEFYIFETNRVWYLTTLMFWCHLGPYTMQRPFYLDEIALVPIHFRLVLIEITVWISKNSLTLTYPSNINIWLVLWFWYSLVDSWIPLLMLIIDIIHSTYTVEGSLYQHKLIIYSSNYATYQSYIGWDVLNPMWKLHSGTSRMK